MAAPVRPTVAEVDFGHVPEADLETELEEMSGWCASITPQPASSGKHPSAEHAMWLGRSGFDPTNAAKAEPVALVPKPPASVLRDLKSARPPRPWERSRTNTTTVDKVATTCSSPLYSRLRLREVREILKEFQN